jgi:uronate dehydrogenase
MIRKRILLTGAAGRVGRLVRPLLQEKYALRLCDLSPIDAVAGDDEILIGDLASSTIAAASVSGVDAVVHLAGLVAPAVSFEETLAPNYRTVLSLLEACRNARVPRFVFASSHHVFGLHPPVEVTPETHPAPDGFYGLSKVFGEAVCALYARRFGLRTLIIRIGNADPEIVDGRRERMWISGRDLVQLLGLGIEHPGIGCEVVHGASICPDPFFPDPVAHRLGYRPQDRADGHRAASFKPLAKMTTGEGADWLGGPFAVAELPQPFQGP